MREYTNTSLSVMLLILVLGLGTESLADSLDNWQMKQRDMQNTGRSAYNVPAERLNDTFFDVFSWQKPSPGSPGQGNFNATSMVYFPGSGPDFEDLVLGTYHWPKGVLGLDMQNGSVFWQGNPAGGETIARITPAFSNDGATVYVVNDATTSVGYPDGHPLMAFAADLGPGAFWHNGDMAQSCLTPGARRLRFQPITAIPPFIWARKHRLFRAVGMVISLVGMPMAATCSG